MKYEAVHRFRQPVEQLVAMYFTRRYHEAKYQKIGATGVEILDVKDTPELFEICVRYCVSSDAPLPDFAKKVVGDTITVTQTDRWNRKALTGELKIDIKGAPVKVSAQMRLKPEGSGCVNAFVWDVTCAIPLIGGKIERVLLEDLKVKAERDGKISQALLDHWT